MKYLIHIPSGAKLIESEDIIYCKANNNYSKIYLNTLIRCKKKFFIATKSLKELEDILLKTAFYRCHNQFLINFKYFDEFNVSTNSIIMTNKVAIKISRTKRIESKIELLKYLKTVNK